MTQTQTYVSDIALSAHEGTCIMWSCSECPVQSSVLSNVDNRTLHYIDHGIQVLIVLCAHRKHITLFVTFRSIISLLLSAEECQSLKTYR